MRLGGKAMPSLCEEGVSGLAFRFNQHLSSKSEESFNEALDTCRQLDLPGDLSGLLGLLVMRCCKRCLDDPRAQPRGLRRKIAQQGSLVRGEAKACTTSSSNMLLQHSWGGRRCSRCGIR